MVFPTARIPLSNAPSICLRVRDKDGVIHTDTDESSVPNFEFVVDSIIDRQRMQKGLAPFLEPYIGVSIDANDINSDASAAYRSLSVDPIAEALSAPEDTNNAHEKICLEAAKVVLGVPWKEDHSGSTIPSWKRWWKEPE